MTTLYPSQQRALDRLAAGAFVVRDRLGVSLDLDDGTSHWVGAKEWAAIEPLIQTQDAPKMAYVDRTGRSEDRNVSREGSGPSAALMALLADAARPRAQSNGGEGRGV